MSAATDTPPEPAPRSRKKVLLPIVAALVLGGAGFASTYLGFWSPAGLIGPARDGAATSGIPPVVFVPVPPIQLNIPASRGRVLVLGASIETGEGHRKAIEHLMPRVLDAFTTFLSGIDPAAYDKRGVLEIIRSELVTRSRYVLGEEPVKDLLITEFLIR